MGVRMRGSGKRAGGRGKWHRSEKRKEGRRGKGVEERGGKGGGNPVAAEREKDLSQTQRKHRQ